MITGAVRFHVRFPRRPGDNRGFTLVEIMIVVLIIGLLASLAIPALQRAKRNAQNSRFISDLRTFSGAFEAECLEAGGWPGDVNRTIVPPEMVGRINSTTWQGTTSVGGEWDYDANNFGVVAGISVDDPTVSVAQMRDIDAKIDDGNLATGNFRQVGTRYTWALER